MNKLSLRKVKPISKSHTALLVTDRPLRKCLEGRGQKKQLVGGMVACRPTCPPPGSDKPELEDRVVCPSLLTTPREAGPMLTSLGQSLFFLKAPPFRDIESKDERLSFLPGHIASKQPDQTRVQGCALLPHRWLSCLWGVWLLASGCLKLSEHFIGV